MNLNDIKRNQFNALLDAIEREYPEELYHRAGKLITEARVSVSQYEFRQAAKLIGDIEAELG